MTWEKCLKTLGVADSTMRRYLDLLDLPEMILTEILTKPAEGEGEFLEGHALTLRVLNDNLSAQLRLARKVRTEKLSVEDLKKIIGAIQQLPDKAEAFLRVPLHVTLEILRSLNRAQEKKKPYQPKTAEAHLKSIQKGLHRECWTCWTSESRKYLSVTQMNQMLSATADLAEQINNFNKVMRDSLKSGDRGFREIYIHCPLCGRIELIGSLRCSVCWSVLRRCLDCGNFDQVYQKCQKTGSACPCPMPKARTKSQHHTSASTTRQSSTWKRRHSNTRCLECVSLSRCFGKPFSRNRPAS